MNFLKITFFIIILISYSSVFAGSVSDLRRKFLNMGERYQRLDQSRLDILSDKSFRKALDVMGVGYDELPEEMLVYLKNHWDDPTVDFSPGNKFRDSFDIRNVWTQGVSDPGKSREYREYEILRRFFVLRFDLNNQDQLGNIVIPFHDRMNQSGLAEVSHVGFNNFMRLMGDEFGKGYTEVTEQDFVAAVFNFSRMNNYHRIISLLEARGWINLSLLRSPYVDLSIKEVFIQTMYKHIKKHHLSDKDVLLKWWEEVKFREEEHKLEEFIASSLEGLRQGYDRKNMVGLMENDEFMLAVMKAASESDDFFEAVEKAYKNIQSSMETSTVR